MSASGPSVAIATFGGTAQLIVTWPIHVTGNALAPAWYMLLATAVGLAAMAMMRETAPGISASRQSSLQSSKMTQS